MRKTYSCSLLILFLIGLLAVFSTVYAEATEETGLLHETNEEVTEVPADHQLQETEALIETEEEPAFEADLSEKQNSEEWQSADDLQEQLAEDFSETDPITPEEELKDEDETDPGPEEEEPEASETDPDEEGKQDEPSWNGRTPDFTFTDILTDRRTYTLQIEETGKYVFVTGAFPVRITCVSADENDAQVLKPEKADGGYQPIHESVRLKCGEYSLQVEPVIPENGQFTLSIYRSQTGVSEEAETPDEAAPEKPSEDFA